ncbi:class I SAM-dependent rRNA methyltransferase [Alteribacter natronophilus]|uniref:class I SAM-dependent rRNA methyltransferase n=1 Tax=Alteribacter natronophilus TaxID=2583810 RepID=UPI00110DB1D4|nr:class I SAM-dependent rRNA methyltransferase [Alteribacter natronophilus]TMW72067.1 class I SAM-dependent rRNA methyltransferase [Alteribacter natronophilus]
MNEIQVKIKQKFAGKFKAGYPLIFKEALATPVSGEEGTVLTLRDEAGGWIGRGYYGKQNKGYGWVLTQDEDETVDSHFFQNRFDLAFQKRKGLFENPDTTAFRLFNGEGDGIGGLTIDNYDGYLLLQWYSEGIYSFRDEVVEGLRNVASFKGIYEKKRFKSGGKYIDDDDFVTGERGEFPLLVKENGLSFAVYLNEGAMTGVFLDQRHVRQSIREKYSEGRTVLNTFSYTGAFSVSAADGGASETTSVDLANRSYEKTIEQFAVNGLDYEAHNIVVQDVFDYFNYAEKKELAFDTVILDPPSFARSKKKTFSADKDYKNLLKQAIAVTEKGGVIVASTNAAKVPMKKFKGFIEKAFKETGGRYSILEEHSLPEDFAVHPAFPEGDYLKVLFILKK